MFGNLREEQEELFKLAGPMGNAAISVFIDTRLTPVYGEINNILNNRIRTFIDQTPQRLLEDSTLSLIHISTIRTARSVRATRWISWA